MSQIWSKNHEPHRHRLRHFLSAAGRLRHQSGFIFREQRVRAINSSHRHRFRNWCVRLQWPNFKSCPPPHAENTICGRPPSRRRVGLRLDKDSQRWLGQCYNFFFPAAMGPLTLQPALWGQRGRVRPCSPLYCLPISDRWFALTAHLIQYTTIE